MDAGGLTADVSIVHPCNRRLQPLGYNQGRERVSRGVAGMTLFWSKAAVVATSLLFLPACSAAQTMAAPKPGTPATGEQGGDGEATQARDIQAVSGASAADATGTGAADSRADAPGAAAGYVPQRPADHRGHQFHALRHPACGVDAHWRHRGCAGPTDPRTGGRAHRSGNAARGAFRPADRSALRLHPGRLRRRSQFRAQHHPDREPVLAQRGSGHGSASAGACSHASAGR